MDEGLRHIAACSHARALDVCKIYTRVCNAFLEGPEQGHLCMALTSALSHAMVLSDASLDDVYLVIHHLLQAERRGHLELREAAMIVRLLPLLNDLLFDDLVEHHDGPKIPIDSVVNGLVRYRDTLAALNRDREPTIRDAVVGLRNQLLYLWWAVKGRWDRLT